MSAPQGVDVLAVMDAVAARIIRGDCAKVDELLNARAAVSELVEAANILRGHIGFRIDDPRAAMLDRLHAACARIGSAK